MLDCYSELDCNFVANKVHEVNGIGKVLIRWTGLDSLKAASVLTGIYFIVRVLAIEIIKKPNESL